MNERGLWEVVVTNNGHYGFQYKWELSSNCCKKGGAESNIVSVFPEEGRVEGRSDVSCRLTYSPHNRAPLKDCSLLLKVRL